MMLLKHPALAAHLKHKLAPLYIIIGQDPFLMNEAATQIKTTFAAQGEYDKKIIDVQKPADWALCFQEANSYSLFAPYVLVDIRYDKKTLDATGKAAIQAYLNHVNPRCLVLIQANQLPLKQLQWCTSHQASCLIQVTPLSKTAMQQWIAQTLKHRQLAFDPGVPALIHQYGQHNMLACAAVIEKLSLIMDDPTEVISIPRVIDHLSDQCDYPLYELIDAYLSADHAKVVHMMQHAYQTRTEPTWMLWLLSQEIRQLIQLTHLTKQGMNNRAACGQLKIWSHRIGLYEKALKKFNRVFLYQLLQYCQRLDEQIKTGQNNLIWQSLENIALAISHGDAYELLAHEI